MLPVGAITKGLGELGGAQLEEVVYEGRGPQGASFIVEVMTDNRNRIVAEVRHVFTKGGGELGSDGFADFVDFDSDNDGLPDGDEPAGCP